MKHSIRCMGEIFHDVIQCDQAKTRILCLKYCAGRAKSFVKNFSLRDCHIGSVYRNWCWKLNGQGCFELNVLICSPAEHLMSKFGVLSVYTRLFEDLYLQSMFLPAHTLSFRLRFPLFHLLPAPFLPKELHISYFQLNLCNLSVYAAFF